jgi:hypothetical protein
MVNRVQTLRSSVPGTAPAPGTRQPGELYVNFPDNAFGVIDPTQNPVDLIAVRFFSPQANYAIGDFVVQAGNLYCATAPSSPGVFVPANWSMLGTADLSTVLALSGGTMTGALVLAGDPTSPLEAATMQYVDSLAAPPAGTLPPLMNGTAAVGVANAWSREDHVHPRDTGVMPLNGGTFTGGVAFNAGAIIPAPNLLQISGGAAGDILVSNGATFNWGTLPGPPPAASTTPPLMDGTVAVGVGTTFARADHVHPSDTSRLALTGGTLTGPLNGTTAAFSGAITPSQTAGIVGTTTNNNANPGAVGELIQSNIPNASAVTLANNNIGTNVTSITLTPGDWDVWGSIYFFSASGAIVSAVSTIISNQSANNPAYPNSSQNQLLLPGNAATNVGVWCIGAAMRFAVSVSTPIYLVATVTYTGAGGYAGAGWINARRRR